MNNFKIYNCDVFQGIKLMQEAGEKIDCVMTSPPYWALRDYHTEGQIGLEPHPQEYIDKIVSVFREVKKVLKKEGSLWLNLGDTYFGSGKQSTEYNNQGTYMESQKELWKDQSFERPWLKLRSNWLQPKQKMLIPHRIAIAMQEDGWILRNDIIWDKLNYMPSPANDRLTNSFEYVFHFVQQRKYYYDLYAIREQHNETTITRCEKPIGTFNTLKLDNLEWKGSKIETDGKIKVDLNPAGKNPVDVWSMSMEPFPEGHFATYPTKLCWKPIAATCPNQICKKCGKARIRTTKTEYEFAGGHAKKEKASDQKNLVKINYMEKYRLGRVTAKYKTTDFSDCGCGEGFVPGVVLDPFVGSGTTLLETQNQGKNGIGIEINEKYIPLIKLRLNGNELQESLNPNKITVVKL